MPVRSHYSETLIAQINDMLTKLGFDMVHGCASDFGDYRQLVGRAQGLEDALKMIDDVDAKVNGE